MEISINHKSSEIPEHYSVQQLLFSIFPENQKGIAVAINQHVVPKSNWATQFLMPQDSVTLIKATQGG